MSLGLFDKGQTIIAQIDFEIVMMKFVSVLSILLQYL